MEIKINSKFNLGTKVFVNVNDVDREVECETCGGTHTVSGRDTLEGTIATIDFSFLQAVDGKPYQRVIYLVKTKKGTLARKGENVWTKKSDAVNARN